MNLNTTNRKRNQLAFYNIKLYSCILILCFWHQQLSAQDLLPKSLSVIYSKISNIRALAGVPDDGNSNILVNNFPDSIVDNHWTSQLTQIKMDNIRTQFKEILKDQTSPGIKRNEQAMGILEGLTEDKNHDYALPFFYFIGMSTFYLPKIKESSPDSLGEEKVNAQMEQVVDNRMFRKILINRCRFGESSLLDLIFLKIENPRFNHCSNSDFDEGQLNKPNEIINSIYLTKASQANKNDFEHYFLETQDNSSSWVINESTSSFMHFEYFKILIDSDTTYLLSMHSWNGKENRIFFTVTKKNEASYAPPYVSKKLYADQLLDPQNSKFHWVLIDDSSFSTLAN